MLQVRTYTLGAFQVHNYLVFDEMHRQAVLIDTGLNPEPILETLIDENLTLALILYTHTHLDHVEGHATIRKAYPEVPAWMAEDDQFLVDALDRQAEMFRMPVPEAPQIMGYVTPGQQFEVPGYHLEVRPCPGHTPGGISYYVPQGPFLFTGDTIFAGTIGRTDFPRGDFDTLIRSIADQVLTLPDDTIIYPGHGPSTTVGEERNGNPYVRRYLKTT